jgi:hypothetical protein
MKDLLIVSTYGPDATRDWRDTQWHFIDKYTHCDYDYKVWLHGIKDESKFKYVDVIGSSQGDLLHALPEMFHQIRYYFRHNKYKNYLLLDSDCFPVKHDWYEHLVDSLEVSGKWYAAPVRTDNLDVFPHPCALFIRGEYIDKHLFTFRRQSTYVPSLKGEEVFDIGTAFKTDFDGKHILFPLLRSNFINPHPILGAIYGDLFYHHGAGSRPPFFRSNGYWEKCCPALYDSGRWKCFKWFKKDPERFIARLRGEGIVETQETLEEFLLEG